ncbi:MAG: SGNH/GDSL hydrolase family protein [Mycetocola sp.]
MDTSTRPVSEENRLHRKRFVSTVLLRVGLPVVVGAVLVSALFATLPRPAAGTSAGAEDGPVVAAEPQSVLVSFAEARDRITDSQRPFVVTVIGDSTGNEAGEWVDVAFRELSEDLDRPLVQHPWDILSNTYLPEIRSNADATAAPIIVWNGSASGKTGAYSLAHFATLVPEQPDLVIFNHGLNNVPQPATVAPELTALVAEVERYWPRSVGFAAILENPRFDQWATAHAAVIDNVTSWLAENQAVRGIDVHSAYIATGVAAETLLLPDLLHPTPAGSALTAATVLEAFRR